MSKLALKNLIIKTKDKELVLKYKSARVFATRYTKVLKANEFHAPLACKFIIESDDRIWCFLLAKPFIISNDKGDVEVLINVEYSKVAMEVPYATEEEIAKAKNLSKAYKHKASLGLTALEAMEKARVDLLVNIDEAIKIKVPFKVGGGF